MDYKELGITEQQMREIDNIFSNTKLLECMERGLTNSGKPTPPSIADERAHEAIEAFSNNPPEFRE